MNRLEVDADIRRAHTLPASVYTEREWFVAQTERIFKRSWHLYPGHVEAKGGISLLPFHLAGAPLVLVKDGQQVRCLSNVCTHRGSLIVHENTESTTRSLRCGYHGRCFDLDGKVRSMPFFEGVEGFPGAVDHLPSLPCESLGPLTFVSLDPAHSFSELTKKLRERLSFLPLDELRFESQRTYRFDANWALYMDNALEGFHIPFVHPTLNQALDVSEYDIELFPYGSLQVGVAKDDEVAFDQLDDGRRIGGYYYWLFPATMLNFYPWGVSVNAIVPESAERTSVVYTSYVWRPELRDQGAGAGLHAVELEDEAVVIDCHRGMRSPLYDRGRYSPSQEQAVHHFHRHLARFLNAEA